MKLAPVIHTRTFSCDFNSEFMVRPNDFSDCTVKWARKQVLIATSSIDNLNGERWLIADNGEFRIAGIVSFIKNLSLKCSLSDDEKKVAEEFFYDDKGRSVYAFIGIVIKEGEAINNLSLSYDYFWKLYLKHIKPIWKRSFIETVMCDYENYNSTVSVDKSVLSAKQKIGQTAFFETSPVNDRQIFENLLNQDIQKKFLFCSNITDINVIRKNKFSVITTSGNVITRVQRDVETQNGDIEEEHGGSVKPGDNDDMKELQNLKKGVFYR